MRYAAPAPSFNNGSGLEKTMRGYLILVLIGILLAGCAQPEAQENETLPEDGITTEPVEQCIGPVCGMDGETYATDCEAEVAGVYVDYMGECLVLETCVDSDGGMDVTVAGTVELGDDSYDDYCADNGTLQEYNCVDNEVVMIAFDCAEGQECSGGRCVDTEPPVNETPEVNMTGCEGPYYADIFSQDTAVFNGVEYTDECIEFDVVKDYLCKDDLLETINNECPSGYGCNQGVCVEQPFICKEDDLGNDTTTRSRTVVTRGLDVLFDQTDECADIATLKEHYCALNGTAVTEEITAPSGKKCLSGKFVDSKCSETDSGFDIYEFGVTSVYDVEEEDDCITDYEIREYYCYGDEIYSKITHCGEGYICSSSNDKCVEGSIED